MADYHEFKEGDEIEWIDRGKVSTKITNAVVMKVEDRGDEIWIRVSYNLDGLQIARHFTDYWSHEESYWRRIEPINPLEVM